MSPSSRSAKALIVFLPNLLSLARMPLACVFAGLLPGFFLNNSRMPATFTLFGVICLSDLLDGLLARKLGSGSASGAWLDLSADVLYIVLSLVILNTLGQVPIWFTVLVIIKFVEYLITSRIIRNYQKDGSAFFSDPIGRCMASMYFFLPGIICILHSIPGWDHKAVVDLLIIVTGALTVLSSIIRFSVCIKLIGVQRSSHTDL